MLASCDPFFAGGHAKRYAGDGWGWRCALLRVKYGHVMWHHDLLERFVGTLSISSFEEIDELANYHDSSQIHMQWICPSWKPNIDTKNPHNWKENPLRNHYLWDPAASFPGCRPLDMFFRSSYLGSTTRWHVSQQGHVISRFTYLFGNSWCLLVQILPFSRCWIRFLRVPSLCVLFLSSWNCIASIFKSPPLDACIHASTSLAYQTCNDLIVPHGAVVWLVFSFGNLPNLMNH